MPDPRDAGRHSLVKHNTPPFRGGADISGFGGWYPMRRLTGRVIKEDGTKVEQTEEVFANVVSGHIYQDKEKGWDGEPPWATGDLAHLRHGMGGSDELWESFRQKAIEDAEREGVAPPLWTRKADA